VEINQNHKKKDLKGLLGNMETSKRLEGIGEYYFSQKLREIDVLIKQG
jgi:hypothetical protein